MEIRDNEDICIIAPICEKLDSRRIKRIVEKIQQEKRKVAID